MKLQLEACGRNQQYLPSPKIVDQLVQEDDRYTVYHPTFECQELKGHETRPWLAFVLYGPLPKRGRCLQELF